MLNICFILQLTTILQNLWTADNEMLQTMFHGGPSPKPNPASNLNNPGSRTLEMSHLEQDAMLLVLQSEHEQQIAQMSELRRQRSATFRHQMRSKGEPDSPIPKSNSYESAADLERVRTIVILSHKFLYMFFLLRILT